MFLLEVKREFIQTNVFTREWEELGFTDTELRRLENELLPSVP